MMILFASSSYSSFLIFEDSLSTLSKIDGFQISILLIIPMIEASLSRLAYSTNTLVKLIRPCLSNLTGDAYLAVFLINALLVFDIDDNFFKSFSMDKTLLD